LVSFLNWGRAVEMFRLDYLSCLLTVVATILVGHTSQYGFIPANVFCICVYAFNLKAWLNKGEKSRSEQIGTLA
jgi:hypothetical protein